VYQVHGIPLVFTALHPSVSAAALFTFQSKAFCGKKRQHNAQQDLASSTKYLEVKMAANGKKY